MLRRRGVSWDGASRGTCRLALVPEAGRGCSRAAAAGSGSYLLASSSPRGERPRWRLSPAALQAHGRWVARFPPRLSRTTPRGRDALSGAEAALRIQQGRSFQRDFYKHFQ